MFVKMEIFYWVFPVLVPWVVYVAVFRKFKLQTFSFRDLKNVVRSYLIKKEIKKYKEKYQDFGNQLENEIKIDEDKVSESQYFYGLDQKGNSLVLKFDLCKNAIANISIDLRIEENCFILPGKSGCLQTSIPKNQWKTNGLNIEILEPLTRLRITYNGLLKNVSKNDKIEHLQFNFIFVAACSPHYVPFDIDDKLLEDFISTLKFPNIERADNDQFGLEQFGVLKGFAKINSSEDYILNLPTCRSRFRGIDNKFIRNKIIKIVAIDEYGNSFNIVSKWFKDGVAIQTYGFAYLSNEKRLLISSIQVSDFDIKTKNLELDVKVVVNKKIYDISINLNYDKTVKFLNNSTNGCEFKITLADCKICKFSGKALVEFWHEHKGKNDLIFEPKLCEKNVENLPEIFLSDIKSEESQILELTGGKGCSLALLSSLNSSSFTIPDGFVVTVNAYKAYLQQNPTLLQSISNLNDICCGKIDGQLENTCDKTVNLLKTQQFPHNLQQEIMVKLDQYSHEQDSCGWAVRSSAIGEDSEELSAAGQNETFLGCQTKETIIKSIQACWASLYAYQSVQYRRQHGLAIIADIAVVVQKMVNAESAGVIFTCHPSTSNPSQIVITSNFGLGETVVSGESDPDTFVLNRTWDNQITLGSKLLGNKNKILKMTETGLKETNLNRNEFSLTESQAIELGKVGIYLENAFGKARDIEWGFYNGTLYVFQSRPITTLNTWTDFELSHELDFPFMTENFVSTTANIREVVPKAVTVLTRTSSLRSLDYSLQKHVKKNFDPVAFKGLVTYQHNIFLDVVTGIHFHGSDEIKVSDVTIDLAIFGHQVIDQKMNRIIINRHGLSSNYEKFREIFISLPIAWKNKQDLELARNLVKNFRLSKLDDISSPQELYETINSALVDIEQLSIIHSRTTRGSVFYQICTMNILLERNKEILTEHMSDFALILSSCEDVISAEVPKYLEGIARILKTAGCSDVFRSLEPYQGVDWLKNNCSEAYELFSEFVEKHGHRSLAEFEVFEDSWQDSPAKIINMIQVNLDTERKGKNKMEIGDVIEKLKSPKSSITRFIIKILMKNIRVAVGIREHTKSLLIKSIDILRKAFRKLGQQMVLQGLLPKQDLIFHLTTYEIGLILQSRNPVLITKAVRRQKLYSTWKKMNFKEVMYGIPKPDDDSCGPVLNPEKVCRGTPCCRGVVQARACVIRSLDEIYQLKAGDILITYSTDIGWSPYFPMLSGVVTELGGLVSHGAVVAREYGLPCVVGVQNVLKYFKTGDIIQLNGDTGEIGII